MEVELSTSSSPVAGTPACRIVSRRPEAGTDWAPIFASARVTDRSIPSMER